MAAIRLFISHSSADSTLATRVVQLLRAALNLPADGIRCTSVDGYRLPGGADTDEQLRVEVREAQAFIGIVSVSSIGSAYVLFELGARWGAQRHLLPLLAPGVPASVMKGPLAGLNALRADTAAQVHQMVSEVASQLGVAAGPPATYQDQLQAVVDTPPQPPPAGSGPAADLRAPLAVRRPNADERDILASASTEARELLVAAARGDGSIFTVDSMQGCRSPPRAASSLNHVTQGPKPEASELCGSFPTSASFRTQAATGRC
jgi:hypothetical protein